MLIITLYLLHLHECDLLLLMMLLLLLLVLQELSVAREAAERSAKECTELSALLQPLRDEMTSLKTRLTEAEKVASRVLQAEGNARYTHYSITTCTNLCVWYR
jgi:chromosome segregation ATPase